jgi:penicillin-binding protein 1A
MTEAGFLTATQRASLKPARLDVRPVLESTSGTYFSDWVLPEARDRAGGVYGEQVVTTTLDSTIQAIAARAIRRAPLGRAQAAVVIMRPDGAVVAMVGGKNYRQSAFNRATQARRQPGSTFKLFVYLAAIRAGMTPDDMIDDTPITQGDYRPENSVKLAQKVGMTAVIRAARDLGVTTPLPDNLSVALGSSGISLIELTQAYAAVASSSYPVIAHGLPEKERSWFTALLDRPSHFSNKQLAMLRDLLSAAANGGTGRQAALRTATFGKTGTTQDNRDAIFVGYAGGLVTAVWVGNDDNSPLPGVSGGGLPARIWRDIMVSAVEHGEARTDEGKQIPLDAVDEATNAIANATIDTEIGNIGVEIRPESIRLRGAGNLSVDIPLEPVHPDTPAPEPPLPPDSTAPGNR